MLDYYDWIGLENIDVPTDEEKEFARVIYYTGSPIPDFEGGAPSALEECVEEEEIEI